MYIIGRIGFRNSQKQHRMFQSRVIQTTGKQRIGDTNTSELAQLQIICFRRHIPWLSSRSFLFYAPFLPFLTALRKSMLLISPLLALELLAKGKGSFWRLLDECVGKLQVALVIPADCCTSLNLEYSKGDTVHLFHPCNFTFWSLAALLSHCSEA